jgi:hypothetical protein
MFNELYNIIQTICFIGTLGDGLSVLFQFIEALGALATFGAFLFLFKKDTDKQKQIDKLALLADKMDAQNEILKESNALFALQIDIFKGTLNNQAGNNDANNQLAEIEEKRLKLSVKPIIKTQGSRSYGYEGTFHIHIVNIGKRAKLIDTPVITGQLMVQPQNAHLPYDFEANTDRWLFFQTTNGAQLHNMEYEINIIFLDDIGTKYKAIIKGTGAKCKIVDTVEVEE